MSRADDKEFAARVGDFIDLDEFARYLAVMVYLSDIDGILGPGQNLYLLRHPATKKFVFVPWDMDRAWGQFARATQDQRDRLSIHHPWQGDKPFLDRVFKVEAFKESYLGHLGEFSKTIFRPDRIAGQVDETAAAVRPAVADEPTPSLDRFDLAAAGKPLPPVRSAGSGGNTQPVKPFARVRTQSVLDQLAGRSDGLTLGAGFGQPPMRGRSELGSVAGPVLFRLADADGKAAVTEADVARGFERLFKTWDAGADARLGYTQLRAAMEKSFTK